jgi:hypothetical protein
MRSYTNDPLTPPEFYRDLFHEGTLLLVVKPEDLCNPQTLKRRVRSAVGSKHNAGRGRTRRSRPGPKYGLS